MATNEEKKDLNNGMDQTGDQNNSTNDQTTEQKSWLKRLGWGAKIGIGVLVTAVVGGVALLVTGVLGGKDDTEETKTEAIEAPAEE